MEFTKLGKEFYPETRETEPPRRKLDANIQVLIVEKNPEASGDLNEWSLG
jgi:hypothetical protein